MPTVLRAEGLRFIIFVDDHDPAHVHAYGDGEAKIEIGRDGRLPSMIYAQGMSATVQRKAMRAVAANQTMLLERWTKIHGRAD